VTEVLGREGVEIRSGTKAEQIRHDGDRFTVTVSTGETLTATALLVATGRAARLDELGLAAAGLDPAARAVNVDDRMRAGDGLWAVGDVTGRGAFTHVAMYQADIAVRDILGEDGPPADYRALPRVTFTDPEIGGVGLTEHQAREQGLSVQIGVSRMPEEARGWIHKAGNDGFVKLVADADRGVLVGATSAGPAGGEVLSGLAVAVHGEVPVDRLRHMIYAYPTFHRAVLAAVRKLA
jgi:pyruvate/2-oxoglutarate dehydrogenase complex dihydrolipoamide dehydrogenase (E3) component